MIISIDIPDQNVADAIGSAQIAYWGRCEEWDRRALSLVVTVEYTQHRIDRDGFRLAASKMAVICPYKFAEMMSGHGDCTIGDALIQFACFGELRYG